MSRLGILVCSCVLLLATVHSAAAGSDIVLRASNAANLHGNWYVLADSTAAGGQYLASTDFGWSTMNVPLAQPNDYFDVSFSAAANTPYHVWFRLRATGNSKYNDSVWVQYSDAQSTSGAAVYTIGSTSGQLVNLERCSGCGDSAWGWQDGAYWLSQPTTVKFATTGTHTLRVQLREDGVQIDQIVLSPTTYVFSSPGPLTNDTTIVPISGAATTAAGPYLGSPVALPGRIEAENFDNGPDGTSYHDTTAGNAGGAYRQTNADLEACAEGGYDLGWIAAGEWMNYAVNVQTAGSYTVKLRVASPSGGGSLHLGFNGPSNVWKTVSIPATGSWQTWTTVSVPVTLGAGSQLMTLSYDTSGFNLNYIDVVSGTTTGGTTPPPPPPATGGSTVTAVTWNIRVESGTAHAQQAIDNLMAMSPRPQIIVLDEAFLSLYSTYISELQARSGQTWSGAFQTHCPPGKWNGSSCTGSEDEGVGVFTSLPVISTSKTLLPYADQWHSARALVRVAVNVNGLTLQVFGTHLQVDATARYNSMSMIKSYASGYSAPQIAAGDFNADMDQIDTTSGMYPNFADTWKLVGSGAGLTYPAPSPTYKIDYWFADAGGRAKPQSTKVVTSTGSFSDHYPVMTVFSVQ